MMYRRTPHFTRRLPLREGWYEALFEDQPKGTYAYVYFAPDCNHVTMSRKRHRLLVEVAGWGARVPGPEKTLNTLQRGRRR